MRYTPSGKAVTNFRMGSNRKWKNANGEDVKETTWLKVATWGKLAEIVNQYTEKGSHVLVTGILRVGENGSPEVYELKNGGHGASYEITAREVRIFTVKTGGAQVTEEAPVSDDDIPF
jgi:single-strand DNA-binding protein